MIQQSAKTFRKVQLTKGKGTASTERKYARRVQKRLAGNLSMHKYLNIYND